MSAPTSSSPRKPQRFFSIQILRGLAAVLVLLHHQSQLAFKIFPSHPSARVFDNGAFGVDLFFPISGFVMYLTASSVLRRSPGAPDWRTFLWRRVLRIAPLYYLFTALKLAIFVLTAGLVLHYRFQLWNTVSAFLFLPSFNAEGAPEPPLAVGWTLAYEMLFYLIVTLSLFARRPVLRFCAPPILVLGLLGFVVPHIWGITYLADPIELEFLAGMAIAAAIGRLQSMPAWLPAIAFIAAISLTLLFGPGGGQVSHQPLRVLYFGVPGALVLAAAVALESRLPLHKLHPLLLLGDASFSLYLIHTFVLPFTRAFPRWFHLAGPTGITAFFFLGDALCVAASVLFHLYVELPLLNRLTGLRLPWSVHSADA